jgi:hypothetical protein
MTTTSGALNAFPFPAHTLTITSSPLSSAARCLLRTAAIHKPDGWTARAPTPGVESTNWLLTRIWQRHVSDANTEVPLASRTSRLAVQRGLGISHRSLYRLRLKSHRSSAWMSSFPAGKSRFHRGTVGFICRPGDGKGVAMSRHVRNSAAWSLPA